MANASSRSEPRQHGKRAWVEIQFRRGGLTSISLLKSRTAQIRLILLAVLELYNVAAIPAFLNTEKSIETKAIADNVALKQKAEAEPAEQKSINETEVATNAAHKQHTNAHKAAADAHKTSAEATIARESFA